jgi:hypothetical protein
MPQSHACFHGDHGACDHLGDVLGCTCPCHDEPDDGVYPSSDDWDRLNAILDGDKLAMADARIERADRPCELCGRVGTDDNPTGLVPDPTSSDGRLTVCHDCNGP